MVSEPKKILPVNLEDFIKKIESEENLENLVSNLVEEYFSKLKNS